MIDIMVRRMAGGLMPADAKSEEAIKELPKEQVHRCRITRPRNLWFHKKWFALMKVAFDYWEPAESDEFRARYGVSPEKNFDRFRKDITILAGFFDANYRVNGEVRVEAKSISFAAMDEDEFANLYEKTLQVLISKIFGPDNPMYTRQEIERIVTEIAEFG